MRGKLARDANRAGALPTASMRPAHCAREVDASIVVATAQTIASMRPAHCAREVLWGPVETFRVPAGFNEARALCAGS